MKTLFRVTSFLVLVAASTFAQSAPCTTCDLHQYVNTTGRSTIAQDRYSRYIEQYMAWGSESNLEWFRRPYAPGANFSAGTFELQAIFYNYNGQGWALRPTGYHSSDLPYWYLDTQAFDGSGEPNITIGSAHAYALQPGRWYSWITRVTGSGTDQRYKLQAQRGLRDPPSCYSTWCAFSCDSQANNYNHVPFNAGYGLPGCVDYWTYGNGVTITEQCSLP